MRAFLWVGGVLAIVFASGVEALAVAGRDALSDLKAAMRAEAEQPGSELSGNPNRRFELQSVLGQLTQIRSQMARGNSSYAQEILQRVAATFTSPAVQEAVGKAQTQLDNESLARDAEFAKTAEDLIATSTAAAMKAKSAAEIDPLFKPLTDFRSVASGQQSEKVQREMNRVSHAQQFLQSWQEYVFATEQGDAEKARTIAQNLAHDNDYEPLIPRSRLLELARAKQKGTTKFFADTSPEEVFKGILASALAAKSASGVDPLIEKVNAMKSSYETQASGRDYPSINYANSVLQWMRRWQDFLLGLESGKPANSSSRYAQDYDGSLPGVPRAAYFKEVDRRIAAQAKRAAERPDPEVLAVQKVKSLDEMSAVIAQNPEPAGAQNSSDAPTPMAGLRLLNQVYLNLKAGLPPFTSLASSRSNDPLNSPELIALKGQLARYAVPKILRLPAETQPAPEEGAAQFLQRIVAEARARGDWLGAAQAGDLLISLQRGSFNVATANPSEALRSQQAAKNLEHAGQFAAAVYFYDAALRDGGLGFPLDEIKASLAQIKTDHAAEHDAGSKAFLEANAPQAAGMVSAVRFEMMRQGMGQRGSFGGMPPPAPTPKSAAPAKKKAAQ